MKRVLLIFMCLYFIPVYAQDSHLEFMGIPIDGALEEVASKLGDKGFVKKTQHDDAVIMTGLFAGKDCTVFILATPISKTVWKIAASTQEYDSWSDIKYDYNRYAKMYADKYGQATNSYNFFLKPYYDGDGYEMTGIRSNKCRYSSYYKTPEGFVFVEINKLAKLSFGYEDAINSELFSTEKSQKIQSDI